MRLNVGQKAIRAALCYLHDLLVQRLLDGRRALHGVAS